MKTLRWMCLLLLVVLLPLAAAPAPAPEGAGASKVGLRPNAVRGDEINPEQRAAVEKGLAWLAARQSNNGSFGMGAAYGGGQGGHVGITALAGISFMAAGNLPGRGKYGINVERALKFIMACSQESGFIAPSVGGEMYSHGFATLFLGEVYGMTGDDEVKEKLRKAVRLIERTQNREGGWRYQPAPVDADISITICQVMGLRAARDAGIKVQKETIDNAIKYVRSCQCADGGFSYTANQQMGSGFARTAAGLATLYYAGMFQGKEVERGLAYLKQFVPGKGGRSDGDGHYYYGHYYACQAMFLAGGEYWATWYPAIRQQLLARQNKGSGHWSGEAGEDYATAMALIVLQMPNRYLPVFHGKGMGQ